jgi:hypothetical protein
MAIDIVGYLESVGVDLKYSGENVGTNDIAMPCPWCDDPSYHLTIHRSKGYLNCWRCQFDEYIMKNKRGWRPNFKALIQEIERCSWKEAKEIWEDLGGDAAAESADYLVDGQERPTHMELPPEFYPFDRPGVFSGVRDYAYKYLLSRGFDRYHVEKYNIHFCPTGYYKNRLIIPVYSGGKLVNWIGRRFAPDSKGRYLNCKITKAVKRFTEMLYGEDNFTGDVLRLVEGVFDKMRIGDSALGLSRSQFSRLQRNVVIEKSKHTQYTSIILDPEAESRAITVAEELSPFISRLKVVLLKDGSDPASSSWEEIRTAEKGAPYFTY